VPGHDQQVGAQVIWVHLPFPRDLDEAPELGGQVLFRNRLEERHRPLPLGECGQRRLVEDQARVPVGGESGHLPRLLEHQHLVARSSLDAVAATMVEIAFMTVQAANPAIS